MRLVKDDYLEHAYLLGGQKDYTITFHDKPYALNKVRLAKGIPRCETKDINSYLLFLVDSAIINIT